MLLKVPDWLRSVILDRRTHNELVPGERRGRKVSLKEAETRCRDAMDEFERTVSGGKDDIFK